MRRSRLESAAGARTVPALAWMVEWWPIKSNKIIALGPIIAKGKVQCRRGRLPSRLHHVMTLRRWRVRVQNACDHLLKEPWCRVFSCCSRASPSACASRWSRFGCFGMMVICCPMRMRHPMCASRHCVNIPHHQCQRMHHHYHHHHHLCRHLDRCRHHLYHHRHHRMCHRNLYRLQYHHHFLWRTRCHCQLRHFRLRHPNRKQPHQL